MNTHSTQNEMVSSKRRARRTLAKFALIASMAANLMLGGKANVAFAQTATAPAQAEAKPAAKADFTSIVSEGLDSEGGVKIMVNKSTLIKTRVPVKRVNLATNDVAVFNTLDPQNILITGMKAGTTQMILWDDSERSQVINILVQLDLAALQDQLKTMFPGSQIEVSSVNGAVALRGRVPDVRIAQHVASIAAPYAAAAGDSKQGVLNFLEVSGGQQVMLKVRFVEVSRTAANNLGVNLGYTDGSSFGASNAGGNANFGILDADLSVTNPAATPITQFGRIMTGNTAIGYMISALRSNGLLRELAEPTLIAISGQEANFLAGGEIPIPVSQGTGDGTAITIEYKKFGVLLKFTPIVLGNGHIRLRCAPEVSELDFANAVTLNGFRIPALTNRSVDTTVEMHEGQTLAIGGLLQSRTSTQADSTPVLGAVPILGALFRSVRYERKETELVVLVTPVVVAGMNPAQVPNAAGDHWRDPSQASLFLMRDLGGEAGESGAVDHTGATTQPSGTDSTSEMTPRYRGAYGFAPVENFRPASASNTSKATTQPVATTN